MARKSQRRRRRSVPWKGWAKISPKGRQRKTMRKKCGKKCFLGPYNDPTGFPICAIYGDKVSCKTNDKGLWSAYLRARQMASTKKSRRKYGKGVYKKIARTARRMLRNRGQYGGTGAEAGTTATKEVPDLPAPVTALNEPPEIPKGPKTTAIPLTLGTGKE